MSDNSESISLSSIDSDNEDQTIVICPTPLTKKVVPKKRKRSGTILSLGSISKKRVKNNHFQRTTAIPLLTARSYIKNEDPLVEVRF